MIVWLASYPRSGNHLLRIILQRCFGLGSYEIYQEIARPSEAGIASAMGEQRFAERDAEAFIARARAAPELILIKTHEAVPDGDRCIYVVRDARAALVSQQRYMGQVEGKAATLPELIRGRHWPGKWQKQVRQFLKRAPKNTLILHYEALASGTPPLDATAEFLGIAPQRSFDVSFADLRAMDPKIFPTGSNGPGIAEVERECSWLFWMRCGEAMRALGYGQGEPGNGMQRFAGGVFLPWLRATLGRRKRIAVRR